MEDPARELPQVINLLTAAINPEIQKGALLRYYTPDASFRHPFCSVPSSTSPPSRDAILGIYQWYRVLSPRLTSETKLVTSNPERPTQVFLQIEQTFHIRWSPFKPHPAHLTVHLVLRPQTDAGGTTLYYIEAQEDFYHPEDVAALLVPPLIPLVRFGLHLATLECAVLKTVAGYFGYWSVQDGEGGRGVTLDPRGEPLPATPAGETPPDKKND